MLFRLLTWNINGIRASIRKNLWTKIWPLQPNILAFQEIKCNSQDLETLFASTKNYTETEINFLSQYNLVYSCATNRKGYSGTCLFYPDNQNNLFKIFNSNQKTNNISINQNKLFQVIETQSQLDIPEFDQEGRVNILKFSLGQQKLALINGYYPQGGRGQFRIDYKLRFYQAILDLGKHLQQSGFQLILCGDFNTTFTDIDLARPKENRHNTGCLPEERAVLRELLEKLNLVDAFRYFYPELKDKYTYWDQITKARERNVGWRIDMFLVSQELFTANSNSQLQVIDCQILDQILGSDHCPVILDLQVN